MVALSQGRSGRTNNEGVPLKVLNAVYGQRALEKTVEFSAEVGKLILSQRSFDMAVKKLYSRQGPTG